MITSTKIYIPVVNLSISDNTRTFFWKKYKSEITAQTKNNNVDCLIDPTFRNINRLLLHSPKNGDNVPTRYYFDKYYVPLLEIKDFNTSINNKPFFYPPVRTNKKRMKNFSKCQEIMMQEIYYIICIIKVVINSLVKICKDKQIRVFLNKLIL